LLLDATESELALWSLTTRNAIWRVPIRVRVTAIAVDAHARRAFLGVDDGFLESVDLSKRPEAPVARRPPEISLAAFSVDGRLWTSERGADDLIEWDLETSRPRRWSAGLSTPVFPAPRAVEVALPTP